MDRSVGLRWETAHPLSYRSDSLGVGWRSLGARFVEIKKVERDNVFRWVLSFGIQKVNYQNHADDVQ
jgi:hypothetical protein